MWTSMMFLYVYNDYFSLYMPGTIEMMASGRIGPLGPATDAVMLGVSALLAIPALMVTLSAVAPSALSKWLNVLFGVGYGAVNIATLFGSPLFYQAVVVVELCLCLAIVFTALTWPRERSSAA